MANTRRVTGEHKEEKGEKRHRCPSKGRLIGSSEEETKGVKVRPEIWVGLSIALIIVAALSPGVLLA